MLIGIDGNEANVEERVGVNVWGFEVLKSLAKITKNSENRETRLPRPRWSSGPRNDVVVYLSKPPRKDLPGETENWKYRVIGPAKLWTRWRLPLDLYFHRFKVSEGSDPSALTEGSDPFRRPDVFLSLSHYAPKWVPPRGSTRRAPMPRVVCIMDLSFLKFPEAFKPAVRWQLTNWTRESVKNAARVITISEFNKREIVKYYGYPEEKITVVYPGVSENFTNFQRPKAEGRRPKENPYILFVGTLQAKKNLGRLVEAFGLVKKRFSEIQLVIVGKTWSQFTDMKDQIHPSSRRPSGLRTAEGSDPSGVRYVGFVAEKDLTGLVAGAEALVIPSLYEGFGIPAVEAMAVGTPVVASNVSSLPEVIGDAGILFDPYDTKDMADKICRLLAMSKTERQRLVEKGKIRARLFNWDSASEKVLEVLSAVILRPKAEESRRDPSLRSG